MPSNNEPHVAVIVLTWNGMSLTLDCVQSLRAVSYPGLDIIVVDNGSRDGTVPALRKTFDDRITVIENTENLGFAGGNNVGIRHALDRGADWVLLLNNDTIVAPDFISEMLATAAGFPDAGIIGPKIYYATPPDRIWFAGGEVFFARGTARHIGIREPDKGQYDQTRVVDYITGCALLARRAVFEQIGLLDPAYEAYFEDTDFCMRARAGGFRCVYSPGARVWHRISASTGGQLGRRKITRKLRSSLIFFRRYAAPHNWLTIPLFFTFDVIRIIILVFAGRIRNTPDDRATDDQAATQR